MSNFSLKYTIDAEGSAEVRVQDGSSSVDFAFSSILHNALWDLSDAALALQKEANQAVVRFLDEPGEMQILLWRTDDTLRFEVRESPSWSNMYWLDAAGTFSKAPPWKSQLLFSGETTVRHFISEVRNQLETTLHQYGIEGYKRLTDLEFPMHVLIQLRDASTTKPTP
jgi:hypothetical protein